MWMLRISYPIKSPLLALPRVLVLFGILLGSVFLLIAGLSSAQSPSGPMVIGLDADQSAGSAKAGQSIHRGALIAIHEINARGGLLGRSLSLVSRDHRGNPARALVNMSEFAEMPDLVAVLGGLHTPCALEVLPLVHERNIPFLIPWAAGTDIVQNGRNPNFVFRVSVSDAQAGPFLVKTALDAGYQRVGLLLENTGWGRSNLASMTAALQLLKAPKPEVQWFNWGVKDLSPQLKFFHEKGVEAILLVANAPEGATLMQTLAGLPAPERFPVFSHWGISGGDFADRVGPALESVDLRFLQTFNFGNPPFPERAAALFATLQGMFPEIENPLDIPAAPGLAHAYDLVHLLARAIHAAGGTDRSAIRDALERIDFHAGIMADYHPPFTPGRHEALGPQSFMLARFNKQGQVVPATQEAPSP